jgi:hypothetical protein
MSSKIPPIKRIGEAAGPVRSGLDATFEQLASVGRLSAVHAASIAIAYQLADIIDAEGASTPRVLAAQRLTILLVRLEELPTPSDDRVEFDVDLLPLVDDEESDVSTPVRESGSIAARPNQKAVDDDEDRDPAS